MSGLALGNALIVTREEAFVGSLRAERGRIAEVVPGVACAPGRARLRAATSSCRASSSCIPTCWSATPFRARACGGRRTAAVVAYDAQLASAGITTVVRQPGRRLRVRHRPAAARSPSARRCRALRRRLEASCAPITFSMFAARLARRQVLDDFEPFADDPLVRLVSLMDHTPGQRQFVSLDKYREYNQGKYGLSDAQMDGADRVASGRPGRLRRSAPRGDHPAVPGARADAGQPRRRHRGPRRGGGQDRHGDRRVPDDAGGRPRRPGLRPGHPGRCAQSRLRPLALRQCRRRRPRAARPARHPVLGLRAGLAAPRRGPAAHAAWLAAAGGDRHRDRDPGGARRASTTVATSPRAAGPTSCA